MENSSGAIRAARVHPSQASLIRSSLLLDIAKQCTSLGVDPLFLLDQVGIDRQMLRDPDYRLPLARMVDLLELAAQTTGVDDFGLRLAEETVVPDFGPLTLLVSEAETARTAIECMTKFMHLHCDAPWFHLEDGDYPILTHELRGCPDGRQRQAVVASLARITRTLRGVLGEHWAPESVFFVHAQPASIRRYRDFFRCPIDFLHEANGIVFRREDLDRKLARSSPALRREVERYLDFLAASACDTYDKRVAKAITVSLSRGGRDAETVARLMGTTSRTLNRKLSEHGLNFSMVLEDVRKNLTAQYLIDRDRSISNIIGLVGFSSLSAFSTWFKHAFGETPRAWRKKNTTSQISTATPG